MSDELNQRRGAQAGGYLGIPDIVKKAGLGQCGGRDARKERWIYKHFTQLHNFIFRPDLLPECETLISHCLFPVSLWIFCHHLCPLSPPKLCLNSFCLQSSSSSSLIFFYYCCFCFSNNQGRSLESISNSHLAMSLMFT